VADYHSPTVVNPIIPLSDLNELEMLLLTNIFEFDEVHEKGLYFHHWESPQTIISLDRQKFRSAAAKARYDECSPLAELLKQEKATPRGEKEIELDLSEVSYEFLFQNIIQRSQTLKYVTITTSFTCSKMRADGFGGMATVITADTIGGKSTHDIIGELLEEAGIDSD
jgi:hypothetical protein